MIPQHRKGDPVTFMRSRRSIVLSCLLGAFAFLAPFGSSLPVSAAYPPVPPVGPIGPFIVPSSLVVQAGTEFTVTVYGCEPDKPCLISFNPTVQAPVINGVATATFRAPCKAGVYPVSVVIRAQTYSVDITVVGSCGGVPGTGISTLSTALPLSAGTIATGVVLVIAARTRRRPQFAT